MKVLKMFTLRLLIMVLICVSLISCSKDYRTETLLIRGGREWSLYQMQKPDGNCLDEYDFLLTYEPKMHLSFLYSGNIDYITHNSLVMYIYDNCKLVDKLNWEIEDDGNRIHFSNEAGENIDYYIESISDEELVIADKSSTPATIYKYK